MRIRRIGLAAPASSERPGPGRQLGWHINNLLAVGEQPVRDVPADALASLDRPYPLRPPPGRREHRPVPGRVSAIPATAGHALIGGHDLDGRRALMRIHADDDLAHPVLLPLAPVAVFEPGVHCLETGQAWDVFKAALWSLRGIGPK